MAGDNKSDVVMATEELVRKGIVRDAAAGDTGIGPLIIACPHRWRTVPLSGH